MVRRGSRAPAAPAGIAVIAPRVEPRDAVPPYLAEGLVTEVIGVLTRYRMMRVTPASSSLAPGIGELPPVTIGDTLGVTSILASTVSPEDERYRVTVRLLRASDGSTDWQRSYQFTSGNLGSVARQIGQDAAAELSGGTVTPIARAAEFAVSDQRIALSVNVATRQDARLSDLVWSVAELVSHLSRFYHLAPGDLIYTGTPAGVSAVVSGDTIRGTIDGLDPVELTIGPAT